jgi:hypothetical protein
MSIPVPQRVSLLGSQLDPLLTLFAKHLIREDLLGARVRLQTFLPFDLGSPY